MKTIAVCIGNRAEEGLTAPVRKRIKESSDLALMTLDVRTFNFGGAFRYADDYFKAHNVDIAYVPCDRPEMLACALAAFFNNVPIFHYGAGDKAEDGCHTGIVRHMISFMSDVILVKGEERGKRLIGMGIRPEKIFMVNSTAFDDLVINEEEIPDKPYDIIIYHPPTLHLDKMKEELEQLSKIVYENQSGGIEIIWINPNMDEGSNEIISHACKLGFPVHKYTRPGFLGLLKNCRRIIGNSSCLIYEAPYFLKPEQIIHVGIRNKGRDKVIIRPGGSDQILKVIRRWDSGSKKVRPVGRILESKIADVSQ